MKNNSVYKDAKDVSVIIFILGLVECICLCLIMSFRIDILIGALYGCSFASLNFFYLAYSIKKSLTKSEDKAKAYMSGTYSTRIFLTAVMIFIASKVRIINIWGAIIPLVFPRIAIFILSFKQKKG